MGLVFASTYHRLKVRENKTEWSEEVRRAHRTVTIVLIVVAILAAWQLLGLIPVAIGLLAA